jgi:hypothetical protein
METPITEPFIGSESSQIIVFYLCTTLALLSGFILYDLRKWKKKYKKEKDIDNSRI